MSPPSGPSETLASGFLASLRRFPDRPAVAIETRALSYRELGASAFRIAQTLEREAPSADPLLTAVFGHRSFAAFAGILGALFRGHGYVPLNPAFPVARSRAMLRRSQAQALVVEADSIGSLPELVSDLGRSLCILVPDSDDLEAVRDELPGHRLLGQSDLPSGEGFEPRAASPDDIAYLLFTSGSTGEPKGVMVAHRNVSHFLAAMTDRYRITEQDRFSQTFDLTFDLSVFDLFLAFRSGASVQCPTQGEKLFPSKYVKNHGITVWFSVPSTAVMMKRLRMLKPSSYPSLRLSLFCGEALPYEVAQAFKEAAPGAILENLYGPTELTIACTLYRFEGGPESLAECEQGIVPIGEPYPEMKVLIADEALAPVPPGESGELLMTGPQVALGYFRDPERTAKSFVVPPGQTEIYYRTGDRVRQLGSSGPLVYLGRVDNQIKIQGYRVELGEVEAVLREAGGVDVAIAVGFPRNASGADGIVAFVGPGEADTEAIRERAKARLPPYMHPSEVRAIAEFPLNANGKVDRKALLQMLESGV